MFRTRTRTRSLRRSDDAGTCLGERFGRVAVRAKRPNSLPSSTTASTPRSSLPPSRAPSTMASSSKSSGHSKDKKRVPPEPLAEASTASSSKFDAVSKAILAPFTSRKHDSAKILTDCTSLSMCCLQLLGAKVVRCGFGVAGLQ